MIHQSSIHTSKKTNSVTVVRGWCVAIIAIVSSLAIMHGDTTLIPEYARRFVAIPNYLSTIVLLISIILQRKSFKLYHPLTIYFYVTWMMMSLWTYGEPHFTPLLLIILVLYSGMGEDVWLYAYNKYRIFLLLSSVYGILSFFSYLFSLGLPYTIVPYYGDEGTMGGVMSWSYINYYLATLVLSPDGIRLCGLFNEPGYFGTILALFLISQRFRLSEKGNWILLLAGCLTFSLAFFVLIFVYVLVVILKKPRYIVVAAFSTLALYVVITIIARNNEMVSFFLERFTFEDGRWNGNDRTTKLFDVYWSQMFSEGKFLFGYGGGYYAELHTGSLSYKNIIIDYGLVGALSMWGLLLMAALKKAKGNYNSLLLVFLFFVSIYQRPNIFVVPYYLLLFGGITSIKNVAYMQKK